MLTTQWRFEMLGHFCAKQEDIHLTRFRTQKTAALLAYLVYFAQRSHSREELAEKLWADQEKNAARNSLRVALASLRSQLEPPGTPSGSVLITDRTFLRLNPESILSDVTEFEAALHTARRFAATDSAQTVSALKSAVALYQGELLPGFYEDWVLTERERLANGYHDALRTLIKLSLQSKDRPLALDMTLRSLSHDPFNEKMHSLAMRLYHAFGREQDAARHYLEMERLFQKEMGIQPSPEIRALAQQLFGHPPPGVLSLERKSSAVVSLPTAPLESAPVLPSRPRLPVRFDGFFGREDELDTLCALLAPEAQTRPLVTLTAPGGHGKTRLAVEVGRRLTEAYRNAVWFVPLADIPHSSDILGAIRDSLGLPRSSALTPEDQIAAYLQSLPAVLLILDNFEHLTDGGEQILVRLRECVETLTLLVTSRHRLALGGEQQFIVPPLPCPSETETPVALLRYPGVRLFTERARSARPDFALTERNAPDVVRLCQLLEGIPLSIEMAAARAMTLTPAQMLTQMKERFTFLTSRRKDLPARQQSLHAAIEWSYRLLSPEMQTLFAQLSVFRGGWTAEAVQSVCAEPDAAEFLEDLCTHSLIRSQEENGEMRFGMLETLRLFAEEQIQEHDRTELIERHAAYFLSVTEHIAAHQLGAEEMRGFDLLEREHENLKTALHWYLEQANSADFAVNALQMAANLSRFWVRRGYLREGREWMERGLVYVDHASLPLRAQLFNGIGLLYRELGEFEQARRHLQAALALRQGGEDTRGLAVALHNLGLVGIAQNDFVLALQCYEEVIPLWRQLDEHNALAIALHNLGMAHCEMGQLDRAWDFCMESLTSCRKLGFDYGKEMALQTLSRIAGYREQYALGLRLAEEALALQEEQGNLRSAAISLALIGDFYTQLNDFERGLSCLRLAVDKIVRLGDQATLANALSFIAANMSARNVPEFAVRLLGAAAQIRTSIGVSVADVEKSDYENWLLSLRQTLGDSQFQSEWSYGETIPLETLLHEIFARFPSQSDDNAQVTVLS